MSETKTLDILEEIGSLVTDRLQVVSYKWLSRNFLVSSNAAKKLLDEFVEKQDGGLEVVYSMAGWLKGTPVTYHVRLVTRPMLADAKKEFVDDCSIQVYSVQASVPKDPAQLWSSEFVQAEELFRQPVTVINCLRDNRFCGILNLSVERTAGDLPISFAASQSKNSKVDVAPVLPRANYSSQTNSSSLANQKKAGETIATATNHLANKKKGGTTAKTGGSIANFWGHTSTKAKINSSIQAEATKGTSKISVPGAEVWIGVREAVEPGSSDDDGPDVNFKRTSKGESTRKRRVLLDDSDEEVDYAVNLSSPDPPRKQSESLPSETKSKSEEDKGNFLDFGHGKDEPKEDEAPEESSALNKDQTTSTYATKRNNVPGVAPTSPKRRKALKTRIDGRGREVSEVVWEGPETETKDSNTNTNDQGLKSGDTATVNRAPAVKNPAAVSNKPGNKKAGSAKDSKQGNILSFFKRI